MDALVRSAALRAGVVLDQANCQACLDVLLNGSARGSSSSPVLRGVVSGWLSKCNYGFIKPDSPENAPEVFVHWRHILGDDDEFKVLRKGECTPRFPFRSVFRTR